MTKREALVCAFCGLALGWVLASAFLPLYAWLAGAALCCAAAVGVVR